MSAIIFSNSIYIKKWNILKSSIKRNIIHYEYPFAFENINFKIANQLSSVAFLWDNIDGKCEIPFFNTIKLLPLKKKDVKPQKNKTLKCRFCKTMSDTRKRRTKIKKFYTMKKRDFPNTKYKIIESSRSIALSKQQQLEKERYQRDFIQKRSLKTHTEFKNFLCLTDDIYTYYSKTLIRLIRLLAKNRPGFIVDLISCNMNNPNFIKQTKQLEKQLNIQIRYSHDETGNPKITMGDWIQESHNVSIKTQYFNNYINLWEHTLSNHIYDVNDDNNEFVLNVSGGIYYIKNDLSNSRTNFFTIPTIHRDSSAITIQGFVDFDFHNNNNQPLDVTDFNFENLECIGCDFSNISLKNCSFSNTLVRDSSFANIKMNYLH